MKATRPRTCRRRGQGRQGGEREDRSIGFVTATETMVDGARRAEIKKAEGEAQAINQVHEAANPASSVRLVCSHPFVRGLSHRLSQVERQPSSDDPTLGRGRNPRRLGLDIPVDASRSRNRANSKAPQPTGRRTRQDGEGEARPRLAIGNEESADERHRRRRHRDNDRRSRREATHGNLSQMTSVGASQQEDQYIVTWRSIETRAPSPASWEAQWVCGNP